MASLSYDYRWNPINANFNDANSLMAAGSQKLSGIGDIFSKLADRIAEREARKAELELKQAGLDMDRERIALDRDKMGQAWDIAMMQNATEKEKIQAQAAEARRKALREALAATSYQNMLKRKYNIRDTFPEQIDKLQKQEAGISGYHQDNIGNLSNLEAEIAERQKVLEKMDKAASAVDEYRFGDINISKALGIRGTNDNPEYTKAQNELAPVLAAREALSAMLNSQGYQDMYAEDAKKAADIKDLHERMAAELADSKLPQWEARAYAEERAKLGLDPYAQLPYSTKAHIDAIYDAQKPSNKSGKSDSGGDNIESRLGNTTLAQLANELKIDWNNTDTKWKQIIMERAKQYEAEGRPAKQAVSDAMADYNEGKLWNSMNDMTRY